MALRERVGCTVARAPAARSAAAISVWRSLPDSASGVTTTAVKIGSSGFLFKSSTCALVFGSAPAASSECTASASPPHTAYISSGASTSFGLYAPRTPAARVSDAASIGSSRSGPMACEA